MAANKLLQLNLFAPSVHCSYYSCFQLLKFVIKDFFGQDYEKQAVNISTSNQKTHQYVVNYITNELKNIEGIEKSRWFKRNINDLKNYRNESDYENVEVNYNKGNAAFNLANEIRNYVLKSFNI
ncbi:MAG: hypothetical protein JXR34_01655 [Bacteroidales bacterium]|nr:hypothetical protein [Bacteroidales bacterium]